MTVEQTMKDATEKIISQSIFNLKFTIKSILYGWLHNRLEMNSETMYHNLVNDLVNAIFNTTREENHFDGSCIIYDKDSIDKILSELEPLIHDAICKPITRIL